HEDQNEEDDRNGNQHSVGDRGRRRECGKPEKKRDGHNQSPLAFSTIRTIALASFRGQGKRGMSELTELEGTVLGLLAAKPESTAYEVRREFQKSGTAHWRASAGAIYP